MDDAPDTFPRAELPPSDPEPVAIHVADASGLGWWCCIVIAAIVAVCIYGS